MVPNLANWTRAHPPLLKKPSTSSVSCKDVPRVTSGLPLPRVWQLGGDLIVLRRGGEWLDGDPGRRGAPQLELLQVQLLRLDPAHFQGLQAFAEAGALPGGWALPARPGGCPSCCPCRRGAGPGGEAFIQPSERLVGRKGDADAGPTFGLLPGLWVDAVDHLLIAGHVVAGEAVVVVVLAARGSTSGDVSAQERQPPDLGLCLSNISPPRRPFKCMEGWDK